MKFNFKKIASVLAGAVMISSTLGFAAAASYPAPFVVGGNANGAVIVGSNADASDWSAAVDISSDLSRRVSSTQTTASVSGGDAKSLASGSDLVYLNDPLSENVATLTDTDLSTALADGTFTDDAGSDFDYEQIITMGTSANNGLKFSDSSNDLDDPEVLVALTSSTSTPAYTLQVTFNKALNASATDSEGEAITLFGKQYTIGTASDTDTLVLLGGSAETTVNVGESITADIGGESYEVTLNAISDATTSAEASITINGQTKTFTQGQSKKIGGVDVYAKTIFRSGENAGYTILQLGSDKITLEHNSEVKVGSENTIVEGTLVSFTPSSGSAVEALTKIQIAVSAADNNEDYILKGNSFVDPVFGSISLDFVDLKNGPELTVETDTGAARKHFAITKEGDMELGLNLEIPGESAKTVPFVYMGQLADDSGMDISVLEGENLVDEQYFVLNSGSSQILTRVKKITMATTGSYLTLDNVMDSASAIEVLSNSNAINATAAVNTTITFYGQTYTVEAVNATSVKIYSSDYGTNRAVFPYIELIDGKDHRLALTQEQNISETIPVYGGISKIYELPTGNIQFNWSNITDMFKYRIDAGAWTTGTNVSYDTYTVGTVDYVVGTVVTTNTSMIIKNISLETTQASGGDNPEEDPAILYVEDEDKSAATAGSKEAIMIPTANASTAGYFEASSPVFTGTLDTGYNTATFDDSHYVGYVTNYGSYALKDSSDTYQGLVSVTYGGSQMYGEIYVSEVGASITPGSAGTGGQINVVKDTDVRSVEDKNLLVVGGSCINTVALKIIDSEAVAPLCGADFTGTTGVSSGQYLIKVVESPYNADKIAMLAAGYEKAETANAVAKIKEGLSTEVGESIYPKVSA